MKILLKKFSSNMLFMGKHWLRKNGVATSARVSFACETHVSMDERTNDLYRGIVSGDRHALARGISLVESSHPRQFEQAQALISATMAFHRSNLEKKMQTHVGGKLRLPCTLRIAISGPPGAGKSSFIEAFGEKLISELDVKIAVLAVDPSSSISGGSLLGDKTRMTRLSTNPRAYIRPSPTAGNLGGVTRSTNEAILLCEAAGYDLILIETVGVGQSEHTVADMVDLFMLLVSPAAGDSLQGIKRGIMEVANIICVTKYDGPHILSVDESANDYKNSLKLMRPIIPRWKTVVHKVSAKNGTGLTETWDTVDRFWQQLGVESSVISERRTHQRKLWLWYHLSNHIKQRFLTHPGVKDNLAIVEKQVMNGTLTPGRASDFLLSLFVESKI